MTTEEIYQNITIEDAKARLRSEKSKPPWDEVDTGIKPILRFFYEEGIETFESCQGGPGHCFPVPTVRFSGDRAEGFRALSVALQYGLRPTGLRRYYAINEGEPVGPA
jgi:hypothetical protein